MSPTIVLRDGKPVLTIGAAGGPTIITQVVLGIVRHLDLKMPIGSAVAEARFHHQWSPDQLVVESNFSERLARSLREQGHQVVRRTTLGVTQAISATEHGLVAIHDPRVPGKAALYRPSESSP